MVLVWPSLGVSGVAASMPLQRRPAERARGMHGNNSDAMVSLSFVLPNSFPV